MSAGADAKAAMFVPDTAQLTKDITTIKSQEQTAKLSKEQEEFQAKVKVMADRFETLLKKHPHGDTTKLIDPGCECHKFDRKDVLSSWSYPLDKKIWAPDLPPIKGICAAYEERLNEKLKSRRYLVFLGTTVVYSYYNGTDSSTYSGSIYFVLMKDPT